MDIHFPAGLPPEAGGPNQSPSESNPALLSLVPAGTWKPCPLVLHSRPYPKPFPHFPRAGVQEPYSGPHPHCSCPSVFESPAPSAQDFCLLQGPDIPQLLRKVCLSSPKGFQSSFSTWLPGPFLHPLLFPGTPFCQEICASVSLTPFTNRCKTHRNIHTHTNRYKHTIHRHTHTPVYTHVCRHIATYIHTNRHIWIHIHTHTHTLNPEISRTKALTDWHGALL